MKTYRDSISWRSISAKPVPPSPLTRYFGGVARRPPRDGSRSRMVGTALRRGQRDDRCGRDEHVVAGDDEPQRADPATTAGEDWDRGTIAVNRGLVAVAYQVHETRGKTRNARRPINLDPTTVTVLRAWHTWQSTEHQVVGVAADAEWVFTDGSGRPIHPHAISQAFERIATRAGLPVIRLHDVRHTHATLLVQHGVPVKVVSERLGHATATFTIETYQHVMPGMQADAATIIETLIRADRDALLPAAASTGSTRLKNRKKTASQR